ncbi:MAG: YbaB/EbfC family nucleoid-associated protein [Proteobacteria bacterium]|nr:YbaB/EbfC family nucleoid-associated protein [Pseudomonadota bacterium]
MKNMNLMIKQAQQMQKKMQEMQQKSESLEIEGSSGGGMVKATVNGKGQLVAIKIDQSIVSKDDIEMLEDLIVAAFNDAKNKVDAQVNQEMASITGGMNIPGLKLPF